MPTPRPRARLRGWIYSVHAGTFGGLLTRVLWFIASLFGASLPLTGYWLWLRRLRKKRRGNRLEGGLKLVSCQEGFIRSLGV